MGVRATPMHPARSIPPHVISTKKSWIPYVAPPVQKIGLPGSLNIGAPASSSPVKGYDDDVQSGEEKEEEEEECPPRWCKGFAKGGRMKNTGPQWENRWVSASWFLSFYGTWVNSIPGHTHTPSVVGRRLPPSVPSVPH